MGTYFVPKNIPVKSYKRWIAIQDRFKGSVMVDPGAFEALQNGSSLLAKGIVSQAGHFEIEDMIEVISPDGEVIGQGMAACSSEDLATGDEPDGKDSNIVVHRSNLVLL